jgi:hypothetical protein
LILLVLLKEDENKSRDDPSGYNHKQSEEAA